MNFLSGIISGIISGFFFGVVITNNKEIRVRNIISLETLLLHNRIKELKEEIDNYKHIIEESEESVEKKKFRFLNKLQKFF